MSSIGPSRKKVDELVTADEDKNCYVVSFDDKKEKKRFVATISKVWIDHVQRKISIPPPKLMKKSTILSRVEPNEETWLTYDVIKSYGPYVIGSQYFFKGTVILDYESAKRKEKELSAGESESDHTIPALPEPASKPKRKITLKSIRLPGEKSSSEPDDEDSNSDQEIPPQKKKKSTVNKGKSIPKKNQSKSNHSVINNEDESIDSDEGDSILPTVRCEIVTPGTSSSTRGNPSQQGQQVLVDQDILMDIRSTQHAVVRSLQLWRARQQPRMEDDQGIEENDPLPTFKLRTLKATLKFNSALEDKKTGEELQRLFVARLKRYAGETVSEYTLNLLDYIFEEKVLGRYSWSGQKNENKIKFKGTQICNAIIRTVMLSFGTRKQIEKSVKSHLQHAEERHRRREKQREKDEAMRRAMEEAAEEED
ncbi:hypothetical protein QAD02_012883 [Eretmocerus hayati]|uniref:Uncharacterized protein n=1 Tax=Eretmocerus hayati TaxID=131215 RepID=A0ACC2P2P8_9HYME|nr:hypothetical protein QAD02_012883 [Eretmocerus hayati]